MRVIDIEEILNILEKHIDRVGIENISFATLTMIKRMKDVVEDNSMGNQIKVIDINSVLSCLEDEIVNRGIGELDEDTFVILTQAVKACRENSFQLFSGG